MNLREGIKQALLANSDITDLVGTRVFGGYAPTGTNGAGPWIVFTKIFGKRESAHDGDQALESGVWQFSIGGTNKVNVDAVQEALKRMNATTYTHEGVVILFFHNDDRDAWSDGTRVQDPTVDLEVWVEN